MKEDKFAMPLFICGVVGMVAGLVANKIYEKRVWRKQLESDLALHWQLHSYANELEKATEQYCTDVDEVCAEADNILAKIEESEREEES